MIGLLRLVLAFLGSATARLFAEKLVVWVAFKAFMIFLFVMIFPIIINNMVYDLIEIMKNFAEQQTAGVTMNGGMSFSGFMAWLLECFRVAECFSVVLGAVTFNMALRMVPFVRLG